MGTGDLHNGGDITVSAGKTTAQDTVGGEIVVTGSASRIVAGSVGGGISLIGGEGADDTGGAITLQQTGEQNDRMTLAMLPQTSSHSLQQW